MWRRADDLFSDDEFPYWMRVTTRGAGNMRDPRARRTFAASQGIDFGRIVTAQQVHGREVAVVSGARAGTEVAGVDGLITRDPEVILGLFTADCLPVFFGGNGAVGLVHAGWRGLAKGIIAEAVAVFQKLSIPASQVTASVGPHIGKCCYEVSDDVKDVFGVPRSESHVDLGMIARLQLERCGVGRVTISEDCTAHEGSFFSYRRSKSSDRIMSLISLARQP